MIQLRLQDLPILNAVLNATSALLLSLGYLSIRLRRRSVHRAFMLAAFVTSTLFLVSYLTYHAQIGSKHFLGQGALRALYFGILGSHTLLAVLIVPLIVRSLYLALKGRFGPHLKIARWTLPLWLYVSVTGVIIYCMLYPMGFGER